MVRTLSLSNRRARARATPPNDPPDVVRTRRWCPRAIRDGWRAAVARALFPPSVHAAAASVLVRILRATGGRHIVDLEAGAGDVWHSLHPLLGRHGLDVRVRLTDAQPDLRAFARVELAIQGRVSGEFRCISGTAVPADLHGLRTVLGILPLLSPERTRRFLVDAVARGEAIVLFAPQRRRASEIGRALGAALWAALALHGPRTWSRVMWTYLVPVIPLLALGGTYAACRRAPRAGDLLALTGELDHVTWSWSVGTGGGPRDDALAWLTGMPPAPCRTGEPPWLPRRRPP